jgi:uncharacterized protein
MKIKLFVSVILFLFAFTSFSQSDKIKQIEILYLQKIPARDGINLSATIIKPKELKEKLPALFMLTPYSADQNQLNAEFYAKNGYVVVTVDTRGRGNSEGICTPFSTVDGKDGFDVCKWITQQPWSNGKIGMYGGSYVGMVQWQTLKEMPPGLKTIVPTASVCPGIDFPKRNNIFYTYVGPYMAFISGKIPNRTSFTDIDYWRQVYLPFFSGKTPYSKMMDASGIKNEDFGRWIKHPAYDEFWKEIIPAEKEYKQFNIPVLTITGYYDDDQTGALYYYNNFMKYAPPLAKDNHYLVMGPWDHSGTRRPQTELGELKFDKNCVIDINQLHLDWFNWTLKNGSKPEFLKDKVVYYVMGKNEWKFTHSLDNFKNSVMLLYLNSANGKAMDVFHSGYMIHESPNSQVPDTFSYDPLDTRWADYDLEEGHLINYSLFKTREAYKGTGLIYHSNPVDKNITIAGQIKLTTWISMDVKDADFEILLYEVKQDGSAVFLTTDYLRARYRNSLEKEEFPASGDICKYEFKTPYLFVRTISNGSRLRLIIRPMNSPHYQKNFLSGGNISEETSADAMRGHFSLFHNIEHNSYIEIPILDIE